MKILHVPHGYRPARGGAEDLSVGLSEGLAARGHSVRVVVADLATPEGLYRFGVAPSGAADEVVNGVDVRRVTPGAAYRAGNVIYRRDPYSVQPTAIRLRRAVRDRLTSALRSEIDSYRPDVVLTLPHLFENVRAVFEIHSDDPFPFVWMPLLHEEDPNWPIDEIRELIPSADALVALTNHEAARLIDGYGASPDRVHVIPPGVYVPEDPPDAPDGPPTVLYLGRLAVSKGIDRLVQAMGAVWGALPQTRLVIAGATTPETAGIKAMLADYTAGSETGDVEFLPDLSESEKQRRLHAASVLVLPSTMESFGIVLLEAWASAVPVVALDTAVLRDVVVDGVDGRLVEPGGEALSESIIDLLT
ncbi:MAG: glycosyltransferase family 4 protein, partial [Actinomycetota bacterium]|nr:glycosyltransferase family 4 protein [Actinomycetota bacterium]